MITIKNLRNLLGEIETLSVPSDLEEVVDAAGNWIILPSVIDAAPRKSSDENLMASKAIAGGVTTIFEVFDANKKIGEEFKQKEREVQSQLEIAKIPLKHYFYCQLSQEALGGFGKFKDAFKALIVFNEADMRSEFIDRLFQIAAIEDNLLAFSANEKSVEKTHQAIELAQKYSTQLLIFNISSKEEIKLLNTARASEILVHSAVKASNLLDREFLWEGIHSHIIDLVTSDERTPFLLSALLTGLNRKQVSVEEIVAVARTNAEKIFRLDYSNDLVVVDLKLEKNADNGRVLKGWPRYTLLNGRGYPC